MTLLGQERLRFFDKNGDPLVNGGIHVRALLQTQDADIFTYDGKQMENPVHLDSAGFVPANGVWITDNIRVSVDVGSFIYDEETGEDIFTVDWTQDGMPGLPPPSEAPPYGEGLDTTYLITTVPEEDGASATLSGYFENGDGGGGFFVWSAASTVEADSGVVFRPTSVPAGSPGRWIRVLPEGPLHTAWYGAHPHQENGVAAVIGTQWAACQAYAFATGKSVYADPSFGKDSNGLSWNADFGEAELVVKVDTVIDPTLLMKGYADPVEPSGYLIINDRQTHFADLQILTGALFNAIDGVVDGSWWASNGDLLFSPGGLRITGNWFCTVGDDDTDTRNVGFSEDENTRVRFRGKGALTIGKQNGLGSFEVISSASLRRVDNSSGIPLSLANLLPAGAEPEFTYLSGSNWLVDEDVHFTNAVACPLDKFIFAGGKLSFDFASGAYLSSTKPIQGSWLDLDSSTGDVQLATGTDTERLSTASFPGLLTIVTGTHKGASLNTGVSITGAATFIDSRLGYLRTQNNAVPFSARDSYIDVDPGYGGSAIRTITGDFWGCEFRGAAYRLAGNYAGTFKDNRFGTDARFLGGNTASKSAAVSGNRPYTDLGTNGKAAMVVDEDRDFVTVFADPDPTATISLRFAATSVKDTKGLYDMAPSTFSVTGAGFNWNANLNQATMQFTSRTYNWAVDDVSTSTRQTVTGYNITGQFEIDEEGNLASNLVMTLSLAGVTDPVVFNVGGIPVAPPANVTIPYVVDFTNFYGGMANWIPESSDARPQFVVGGKVSANVGNLNLGDDSPEVDAFAAETLLTLTTNKWSGTADQLFDHPFLKVRKLV